MRFLAILSLSLVVSCNTCLDATDVPFRGATGDTSNQTSDASARDAAEGDATVAPTDMGGSDLCESRNWCAEANQTCGELEPADRCAPPSVFCGECGSGSSCVGGTCACDAGFETENESCRDIDECAANTDDCADGEFCINEPGGFVCSACPEGQRIGDDGACRDIDECDEGSHNCDPLVTCTNLEPGFECGDCPAGYEPVAMERQVICMDIDECDGGTNNCSVDATCTNSPGSFTCACNDGYAGDGVTCTPLSPVVSVANISVTLGDGVSSQTLGLPAGIDAGQVVPFVTARISGGSGISDALVSVDVDSATREILAERGTSSGVVTVNVELVEFAPHVTVTSGNFVMMGQDTDVQVNVASRQTFLVFTSRTTASELAGAYVSAELRNDEIRFDRGASSGSAVGTWFLVSSPVFDVTHEGLDIGLSATCSADGFPGVDPSRAFVLYSASGGSLSFPGNPLFNNVNCSLLPTNDVECCRDSTPFVSGMTVDIQLVELSASASVARGTGTITDVQTAATISPVDRTRSTAIAGPLGAAGVAMLDSMSSEVFEWMVTSTLTTATTLELERGQTGTPAATTTWQVVEWPN